MILLARKIGPARNNLTKPTEVSEAAEKKIREAIDCGDLPAYSDDVVDEAQRLGVISEVEAEQLKLTHTALRRAIDVDDFAADELWGRVLETPQAADAA